MSDLIAIHTCVMPAGFGVGDHCMSVINFQESSIVGWLLSKSNVILHGVSTPVSSGVTQNTLIDWKRIYPGTD
jgi:hypothetical protein